MRRLSWTSWLYLVAIVAAAAAILMRAPGHWVSQKEFWGVYVVLALLFLICDSTPIPLTASQSAWSPSSAATLAAVVMLGPEGAAMVGAVAVLSLRRGVPVAERLFHGAMYAVCGYVAGLTYLLGGHVLQPMPGLAGVSPGVGATMGSAASSSVSASAMMAMLGPFAAAAVVHVLVNYALLWMMLRLDRHGRLDVRRPALKSGLLLLLASDLGFAAFGLVIACIWAAIGPSAALIASVPLFVARWAMAQFAEQQQAHADTLAALCQAVETKDFYTRGHSERVSRGSAMIAREIGMRADRVEAMRFAGMLHDVGKLGVPTKVLQKDGPLTEEEVAAIQLHPMRGLEIVGEIGFLNEALVGIMHHHERMDGRGYPMGYAGYEIPVFARVIGVADAFDSMTSTRSYRKARGIVDAVAELRKNAGSQFDPTMVEAFITALSREDWQSQEPAQPRGHEIITFHDHDDPTTPLRAVTDL